MPQEVFIPEIKKLEEMGFVNVERSDVLWLNLGLITNQDWYICSIEYNSDENSFYLFNDTADKRFVWVQIYPKSHEELSNLISILKKVWQPT